MLLKKALEGRNSLKRFFVPTILLIISIISFSCSMPGSDKGGNDPAEAPPEIPPDNPPENPAMILTNVYPALNATGIETTVLLQWDCSNTENVTFDLYKATLLPESNPPIYNYTKIASGLTNCSYNYQNLDYQTEYKWRVEAIDENGQATWGPLWSFTTKGRDNMDDLELGNNSITDGAVHQDTRIRLTWTCKGLKPSDKVFYELYLGTSPNPPLVATDLADLFYITNNLSFNNTYYWSVSVNTQSGLRKRSPVWSFTTRPSQPAGTVTILVIIDGLIYPEIEQSLLQYKDDLASENYFPIFCTWPDRPVKELKEILQYYYENHSIAGAFLIGNIPIAQYYVEDLLVATNDTSYYADTVFPSDIFLMDMDENLLDSNGDGIYDQYNFTPLEIFVSRINGDTNQINHYFSKVHSYKTNGSLVDRSVYVFTDNDWWNIHGTRSDNLELIYPNLDFCYDPFQSTRDAYINKLTGEGAEFVIQEIHAYPRMIIFENSPYIYINTDHIEQYNFKASFYIMHDCSAARFTEENVAMAYLMRTDYGLAIFGATEITSACSVAEFIEKLSQDVNWGKAFVYWFNTVSAITTFAGNSTKLLEKIIFGDPTLRVASAF